jgi:hypothetical protein
MFDASHGKRGQKRDAANVVRTLMLTSRGEMHRLDRATVEYRLGELRYVFRMSETVS